MENDKLKFSASYCVNASSCGGSDSSTTSELQDSTILNAALIGNEKLFYAEDVIPLYTGEEFLEYFKMPKINEQSTGLNSPILHFFLLKTECVLKKLPFYYHKLLTLAPDI